MLLDFVSTMFNDLVGGLQDVSAEGIDLVAGLFSKSVGTGDPMPQDVSLDPSTGKISEGSISGNDNTKSGLLKQLGIDSTDLWKAGLAGLAGYSQRQFLEKERAKQRKAEIDLRRVNYSGGYNPNTSLYSGVIERGRTLPGPQNIPQRRV